MGLRTIAIVSLSLIAASACTELDIDNRHPVALAGPDQVIDSDTAVTVTLDGSESFDPDGRIVSYEWRFTGHPGGVEPGDDEDAGVEPDLFTKLLEPALEFCPEPDPDSEALLELKWCRIDADADSPVAEVSLDPGGYNFTLFVTDDDQEVSADTLQVSIGPQPEGD